jgi:hypothetical protein
VVALALKVEAPMPIMLVEQKIEKAELDRLAKERYGDIEIVELLIKDTQI